MPCRFPSSCRLYSRRSRDLGGVHGDDRHGVSVGEVGEDAHEQLEGLRGECHGLLWGSFGLNPDDGGAMLQHGST